MVNNELMGTDDVILATGGYDHTIRFWTPHNGICQRIVQHPDSVNALEITPDKHMLAAAGFQHIRMYEICSNNPNPIINYEGVTKNITAVGFQSNCRWMYTGGEDCTARIWDLRARNMQCQRFLTFNHPVNCVALHPNQSELYIGDQNGVINIWDLLNDRAEEIQVDADISIQHICIDPEGNHLTVVDNRGNCYTYSLRRGGGDTLQKKVKFSAHKRYGLRCKYSPDSTMLVTASADQTAKIWRSADLIPALSECVDKDNSLPQSNSLNWPKAEISPVLELKDQNQRWVWDVAFSADSQFIITASSDNTARLWDSVGGDIKREYSGHQKAITALAFADATA